MNWIAHLGTVATIVVSADVASFCVSSVCFSQRMRRWTLRKRWGAHPSIESIALAAVDDPSDRLIWLQPAAILRNPFEPRAREAAADGAQPRAERSECHRPTFRHSTVLQQRIATYERVLAELTAALPEQRMETRRALAPAQGVLPTERHEPAFAGINFQQAQAA